MESRGSSRIHVCANVFRTHSFCLHCDCCSLDKHTRLIDDCRWVCMTFKVRNSNNWECWKCFLLFFSLLPLLPRMCCSAAVMQPKIVYLKSINRFRCKIGAIEFVSGRIAFERDERTNRFICYSNIETIVLKCLWSSYYVLNYSPRASTLSRNLLLNKCVSNFLGNRSIRVITTLSK